jgi:hypothetical protein
VQDTTPQEDDMTQESADIVITGAENIERARWLAVRGALKLEIAGLPGPRTRRPVRVLANEITGRHHGTRRAAYDALNAHIVAKLGPQFDKPLPPAR